MTALDTIGAWFERVMEVVVIALMVGLTAVIVLAVIWRKLGDSFSWYDEVASILLAWLTYYGAALAAYKRAHIGFDGLIMAFPPALRITAVLFGEVCVIAFFAVLAWFGYQVLVVLEGTTLVSLTWVPVQLTQSVIPIGAALFILAQLLSLPRHLARVRAGVSEEDAHIQEAIAEARHGLGIDADGDDGPAGAPPRKDPAR